MKVKLTVERLNEGGGHIRSLCYLLKEGLLMTACVGMERPFIENKRNESAIVSGEYRAKRVVHPRFGECIEVLNEEERDGIFWHVFNRPNQSQGCGTFGDYYAEQETSFIARSKAAFNRMLMYIPEGEEFILHVKNKTGSYHGH